MTILTIFMFSWPHLFSRVTTEDTHLFGIIFFVFITNHLLLSHIPFLELVCLIGSNDDDSFVINAELSSSSVAVVVEGIAILLVARNVRLPVTRRYPIPTKTMIDNIGPNNA